MAPRSITFFFENRQITGLEGEPIAKALFRAGVRTLSYSVKYKRPRGLHCARGRCVMCHMEVNEVPGVPTCITPLEEGMRVNCENFRPFFAPLLVAAVRVLPFPAGFYYRMFTRPAFVRRSFLWSLRKMAGVGRVIVDDDRQTKTSDRTFKHIQPAYDVVVIGAGLSGMSAALGAAEDGASVLLVDEYPTIGGHNLGHHADATRIEERDRLEREIGEHKQITVLLETTAQGFFKPDTVLLAPRPAIGVSSPMRRVRAGTLVLATGGYDVVPTFENSDLPGVFGARAIRLLLERDELRPGSRAVVYGYGRPLRELVQLLRHHNIEIAAVVEATPAPPTKKDEFAGDVLYFADSRIDRANGHEWIESAVVADRAVARRKPLKIPCDLLCTAFKGQGAYELAYHAGFRFEMSKDQIDENRVMVPTEKTLQPENASACMVVGELAAQRVWQEKLPHGEAAGRRACKLAKAVRQKDAT